LSLKIIFEEIKRGSKLDLKQNIEMNYRMITQLFKEKEIDEGVRCLLVDKGDTPKWRYNSVSDIPIEHVEKFFTKHPDNEELNLS